MAGCLAEVGGASSELLGLAVGLLLLLLLLLLPRCFQARESA